MATQKRNRVEYGAAPRVDLLPDAQRAERRHRETLPTLLLAVVMSAVVAAAIWAGGAAVVFMANQRLAAEEAESANLTAQIAQFVDEQSTLGMVGSLSTQRTALSADEVLFADFLDEIAAALPKGATITQYTGQLVASGDEAGPGDTGSLDLSPLCVADSATLTVTFEGKNLEPAAQSLASLEKIPGVKCVVGTKITADGQDAPQTVTAQIALADDARSGRFEEDAQ